ncbi:MAG TPA: nitrite reductase small subunit NirD [Solirubrobacteraceae bacterium]|nr:nitrite reductase small subunit NirD [Solirubrobacteraceae bacterium]
MIRIARADEIPMLEGRSVLVGGRRIAVFRTPEGFRALDHACPHAGGPLSDGIVADRCVTCPLHGWRFDLETGRAVNAEAAVAVHEVVERGGELWLRVAAPPVAEAA